MFQSVITYIGGLEKSGHLNPEGGKKMPMRLRELLKGTLAHRKFRDALKKKAFGHRSSNVSTVL